MSNLVCNLVKHNPKTHYVSDSEQKFEMFKWKVLFVVLLFWIQKSKEKRHNNKDNLWRRTTYNNIIKWVFSIERLLLESFLVIKRFLCDVEFLVKPFFLKMLHQETTLSLSQLLGMKCMFSLRRMVFFKKQTNRGKSSCKY